MTHLTGKYVLLIYMEKDYLTISAISAWNKIQTAFGDAILEN